MFCYFGELFVIALLVYVAGYVFFLITTTLGQLSWAASHKTLQECLSSGIYHEHRIEKQENVRFCFEEYKTKTSQADCFKAAEGNVALISSTALKKQALSTCFYETGTHESIESCTQLAKKFKPASEHDEAIFYCYQTFQDKLTKKQCQSVANEMKFPSKKDYLKQHCQNN